MKDLLTARLLHLLIKHHLERAVMIKIIMTEADTHSLIRSQVHGLPEAGYYIPSFIDESQEQHITHEISKLSEKRWTVLSHRRLLSLPSQLSGTARDTLIDSPMPDFLSKVILQRFSELGIFKDSPHGKPNHCLVNAYEPGQGILPHEDGPAYFPITATVSLNAYTVLDIYEKKESGEKETLPKWRILQEPRSLLVTTGELYCNTLHGIDEVQEDKNLNADSVANWSMLADQIRFNRGFARREGTRISLTYRDVLKVKNLGGVAKFLTKR